MTRLLTMVAILCVLAVCLGADCQGNVPAGLPVVLDRDADGLNDDGELLWFTDPDSPDTDGDGLLDGEEVHTYGTDPLLGDTDGDGLLDGAELDDHGTDPLVADTDGDGLSDGLELDEFFGSDPLNPDTDGDSFLDGEEIDLWLELLIPNETGVVVASYCTDYVSVEVRGQVGVYYRLNAMSGFPAGFLPGETVALLSPIPELNDRTGPVRARLLTGERGFFPQYGELTDFGGIITDFVPTSLSVMVIVDFGVGYEINMFHLDEAWDWAIGDFVEILSPSDDSDLWFMVNVSACEDVLLSP